MQIYIYIYIYMRMQPPGTHTHTYRERFHKVICVSEFTFMLQGVAAFFGIRTAPIKQLHSQTRDNRTYDSFSSCYYVLYLLPVCSPVKVSQYISQTGIKTQWIHRFESLLEDHTRTEKSQNMVDSLNSWSWLDINWVCRPSYVAQDTVTYTQRK